MDQQGPSVAIARLRSTWDAQVKPSARHALVALVVAVFFGIAHVARLGTPLARAGAAGAFALTLLVILVRAVILRARNADPRAVIDDTVARMDPELGAAARRALALVARTE